MPYNSKQRNDYEEESIENFGLFGSLGNHCGWWLVVDVARKGKKVAVMCAEGNTPAREAHIVRNLNPLENPWFFFDGDESTFWVSAFHFGKNELRYY